MPHDAGDYDVAGRRMLTVVDAVVGADVGKTMEERWRFLDDFVRQDNLSCGRYRGTWRRRIPWLVRMVD